MSEPFQFLSFPVEIRLRIYYYLAPNTPTWPFRDDSRPCCPSILRRNRTIYEEAMVEWYSLMPYKVYVSRQQFHILGRIISPGRSLPWMFHAIRFLNLEISLQRVSLPGTAVKASPSRHLELHQYLTACFPPSLRASNLQRLRVELVVMIPFFVANKQPELRQALDSNLSALRNLHGRAEVSISVSFATTLIQILGLDRPNAPFLPWKIEFMAILRAFSYDLEQFIATERSAAI